MYDSYKYVDPDYTYTDPKTKILRNLADIIDQDILLFFESGVVAKRLQELYENPIKIKGVESLLTIHKHLFQDVYSWAGKKRKVEISKAGKQFFPTTHFDNAFRFIDTLILDYKNTSKNDRHSIAEKLAEILDNINYLHLFQRRKRANATRIFKIISIGKGFSIKPEST